MDEKFKNQYVQEPNEERERVAIFKEVTQKRIYELRDKKQAGKLTMAENYELDMCQADLIRAKEFLNKTL